VGAYSALKPLAVLKGPTSKGREKKGRGGKVKGRKGRGGGGRDLAHPKILAWRPYDSSTIFIVTFNILYSTIRQMNLELPLG